MGRDTKQVGVETFGRLSEEDKRRARLIKRKEVQRRYYQKHKERIKGCTKQWREANPLKVKATQKHYVERHPNRVRESHRRWREKNPEKVKLQRARYRKKHREEIRKRQQIYYEQNQEKVCTRNSEYYKRNTRRVKERGKRRYAWLKEKRRKWLELLGGKCSECGFNNTLALDFHHKNPTTKEKDADWRLNDAIPADYVILCANCHRILHAKLRGIEN